MEIQRQIEYFEMPEDCQVAIEELKALREKAFKELINEKLQADESFRIFITFINDIHEEIRNKLSDLKN